MPNPSYHALIIELITIDYELATLSSQRIKSMRGFFNRRSMLDHIMTIYYSSNRPIPQWRRINRTLNYIYISEPMKITVHHAIHSVRKVQHDYVLCPILCKPFRLRAAATPRINDYFSLERIGTTERISISMS